jgi:hypothetical protein|tara:strand:- start:8353 stop:8949 length:597 start_codon:yes stop_codon:yes gene_type:complete
MIKRIIKSILVLVITTAIFYWLEMKLMESGYIEQRVVDIDGNKFLVPTFVLRDSDPRKISDVGSKLTCESVKEILGQKTENNKYFGDIKSVVSKKGTYVDCYEPKTSIAVDYLPEDYYKFNGPDYINGNVYDFYNRMAINESKKEKLFQKKLNYVEVPYNIDICEMIDGSYHCDRNTPISLRKERIKSYLKEKIIDIL